MFPSSNTELSAVMPLGMTRAASDPRNTRAKSLEEMIDELGMLEAEVQELAESNQLKGRFFSKTHQWRFHPNAADLYWKSLLDDSSYSPPELKTPVISATNQTVPCVLAEQVSQVVDSNQSPLSEGLFNCDHALVRGTDTPLEDALKDKCISVEQVDDNELHKALIKEGKRVIAVGGTNVRGLKLELSKKTRTCVVKAKVAGSDYRCVLESWNVGEERSSDQVTRLTEEYISISEKLNRRPETSEFRLHTSNVTTIGDALNTHLEFNIKNKYGEDSGEWKTIIGLINNHLLHPVVIQLANGQSESIVLANRSLSSMSCALYNAYLKEFRETNGVHDKIVSRVKAAINYCIKQNLIPQESVWPYLEATRINRERHVEVEDEDINAMFTYLKDLGDESFEFFINLESTGHFRTNQTMSLKYSQFDFNHNTVTLKPKRGKEVVIPLHKDICERVYQRMREHSDLFGNANYLFPSSRSASGHKANFDTEWDKLRDELKHFVLNEKGEKEYKYCLHDFRETLLGRLDELDDPTLAALLGHLSLHALNSYRKANRKKVRIGGELGFDKLQKIKAGKANG